MNRLIIRILFFVLVMGTMKSFAQQQGQYSQYMMNYYLINPAVSGTEDFIDVRAGYRTQWTGFDGAPRNYYVSGTMPLNKRSSKMSSSKPSPHSSVGAIISGQTIGLLAHNTASLSYSYHLPITNKSTLAMGALGGINQISVDQGRAVWGSNTTENPVNINKTSFDMGVGLWFYNDKIFAGLSSMQILQNKITFSKDLQSNGILNRHFYLTGGYKFKINQELTFIPSILLKGTASAYQVDVNGKLRYKNKYWAGASYRRTDAIVVLAGISVPLTSLTANNNGSGTILEIGYSYDVTTSKLRNYSYGSHEIMVAIKIAKRRMHGCPSDYW